MILRYLVTASVIAVQALAFLVPLEIANAVDDFKAQVDPIFATQARTIELSCPGCPYAGPSMSGLQYSDNDENTIELQVSIQDMGRLSINGKTVFPLDNPLDTISLTASQIRTADSVPSRPQRLGFALEVLPAVQFDNENGNIVPVMLTILDLEGRSVEVDTLQIDLLSNQNGVSIAKTSTIPFEQTPGAECSTSLCRVRAIVVARIHTLMEAARTHASKASAWVESGCRGRKHSVERHRQNKGHHPHRYGGHLRHVLHRMAHLLHQTLRFFIVPALLGVVGGLFASAIGMLVGQALVFLWVRFGRGGSRGNIRVNEIALLDDEKEALVEGGELPPQYEILEREKQSI